MTDNSPGWPGFQYPTNVSPNTPEGAALRNIADNIIFLRQKISGIQPGSTLSRSSIEAFIESRIRGFRLSSSNIIVGTHNSRITTYATVTGVVGSEFYEYDRNSVYIVSDSSGAKKWVYSGGSMYGAFSARPADLGVNDSGFFFTATDIDLETEWLWTGIEWVTIGGLYQIVNSPVGTTVISLYVGRRTSSVAATTGLGAAHEMQLQDSAGAFQVASYVSDEWTSAATNNVLRRWWIRQAGVLVETINLNSVGFNLLTGDYIWKSGTAFTGTLDHANTANRVYSLPDATGNITYQTAGLTNNNFVLGGGGALIKDAGFSVVPAANGGTGIAYDRVADTIALTNQGAAIGSTNFANGSTGSTYRASYYLEDTSADLTAGTIQLSVSFTDDAGVATVTSAALALTAVGRTSGIFFIRRASGNIAYSTVLTGIFGAAKYALYICFERLS